MKEYLTAILLPLLSVPNALKINESEDQLGLLLTVDLDSKDMGPVIGKMGEGAKAIRHLVRVYGFMKSARVSIKFSEPVGGRFYKTKVTAHGA